MADYESTSDSEVKLLPSVGDELLGKSTVSAVVNRTEQIHSSERLLHPNHNSPIRLTSSTHPSYLTNMFGAVHERCVTFCIDTSGSMFNALNVVKEQLMETLYSMAARGDKPMFNLIEFNSHVTQWADVLVQCTPETVAVAKKWLNNLTAKTGTNTQEALLTALNDPACQAVYLITDDLPDQQAENVLDQIIGICGSRHIHCIYITGEAVDEEATEFLEDLAVQTFGSFNIIKLSSHGRMEKIIPVYHSVPSHEKLVWTANNTLRPNIKACSVSTTLQLDPDKMFHFYPHPRTMLVNSNPIIPTPLVNTFPGRYYHPYYWPVYRPSKIWLKTLDKLAEPFFGLSPVAGSILLGKKVIARRLEDGYFYRGTIQSQNPSKSFLVAFGPSKHGKYRQTEYQNVFIFDIVDYSDALRHTIITGDRVLAPWEPDGDRFAPGIVIEGQEKRQENGPGDIGLTVTFSNGRTEKMPVDVAVWIPPTMYDRLALELQMSASARNILYSTAENYPFENLPGYPTVEYPAECLRVDPLVLKPNSYLWDLAPCWYPTYLSTLYGYPPFFIKPKTEKGGRRSPPPVGVCDDDDSTLIPNTGMTKQELEERVMLQLMEHRCGSGKSSDMKYGDKMSNVSKESTALTSSRLLGRREKQEENHLNKHVHFEANKKTEGLSTQESMYFDDSDYDVYGNLIKNNDSGVNTDSSQLFYSSPGIGHRPAWRKFWHNDPSPSYSTVSDDFEHVKRPSSVQPFRETALQAPLEARDQRNYTYGVEWPSSAFKFVDTFAKHDCSSSVKECLSTPKPVSPHIHSATIGTQPIADMTSEEREEVRRENRRRRVLKRETEWQEKLLEEDNMKALMQDHHKERILNQLDRDRQRQIQEIVDIQRTREAKKKISTELRTRIEANQKEEAEKEQRRIAALSKNRERREQIQVQREKEIKECIDRREQIRKQNNEARMKASTEKLDEEETQAAKLEKQHHNAKLHRLHHFQKLEKEGQKKKDLRIAVAEQHQALSRSQIFS